MAPSARLVVRGASNTQTNHKLNHKSSQKSNQKSPSDEYNGDPKSLPLTNKRDKTLHDTKLHPNASVIPPSNQSVLNQSRKRKLKSDPVDPGKQDTSQVILDQKSSPHPDATKSKVEDTRSTRSKTGGSRLKSDLETYFPNFHDIISGASHSPDYILIDEPIFIIKKVVKTSAPNSPTNNSKLSKLSNQSKPKINFQKDNDRIDFSSVTTASLSSSVQEDPLSDSFYSSTHRRDERREKQLRNIEKERAQHEKGQLESLLESLQGPDWLRAMGVTGITDGARKDYEPKRHYFIQEVRLLLNKFATWREAEKRLMAEKEHAIQLAKEQKKEQEEADTIASAEYDDEEEEEEDDDDEDEDEDDEIEDEDEGVEEEEVEDEGDSNSNSSNGVPPSDIDALAARQLRLEAKESLSNITNPKHRQHSKSAKQDKESKAWKIPFKGFFDKPHERMAALGQGRLGVRRRALAFGLPIPEVEMEEFQMPADLISTEALLTHARKKRRVNRSKKDEDVD